MGVSHMKWEFTSNLAKPIVNHLKMGSDRQGWNWTVHFQIHQKNIHFSARTSPKLVHNVHNVHNPQMVELRLMYYL